MKLMVIGGGGREHAIIKKLKENPAVEEIYCLPGNGGIAADAVCVPEIGAKDIPAQVEFAKAHRIDYAVVAPDDPLALGAVDALTEAGIPCFGPDKKAAVIEASKAFSKDLMKNTASPRQSMSSSPTRTPPVPILTRRARPSSSRWTAWRSARASSSRRRWRRRKPPSAP